MEVVEVGPRDGLQSEEITLPVPVRVALIGRLAEAGAKRIETVSFAHPKAVPQMAGAEEICEALTERSFRSIGLVLNDKGLDRALECDLDEINVVAYASDGYAEKNSNASADTRNNEAAELISRAGAAGRFTSVTISVAFGDPIDGVVAPEHVAGLARQFVEAGVDEVALGDTIGVAHPGVVASIIPMIREAGASRVRCHFHNTRNTGYANAVAAVQAGVDALDSSVGGFGGSPFSPGAGGNVATEDLTAMLEAMGIATGIDPHQVAEVGTWLAATLGHEQPPAMLGRAVGEGQGARGKE